MADFKLTDYDGRPIEVGTRVQLWDDPLPSQTPANTGVVEDLGEWDGDYDDDTMRPVAIPPRIRVRFGDGDAVRFVTSEWEYETEPDDDGYPIPTPSVGQVEEVVTVEESRA